ncbi:acyltransferase [Hymenobacter sp. BT523]|uniref:acyltransferase family protein n=1 Tax=Hymenobacter sp. BT523 TaxID=2795725 RepID=UPI0018EC2AC6|nr:acyltransferase [Hymenobacter sp. BT523]MBJ6111415.1 acyltransferase [Hymenobacter sp. BT523]
MSAPSFYRRPGSPVYFPNLNGLRFVAALMVIVHHIEQLRLYQGRPTHWHIPAVQRMGDEGVTLFFVLSGFLITYLLLTEQEQFGSIAVGKFYGRRMLRIWPLYYAVVLVLATWLQGQEAATVLATHRPERLMLYAVLLPNVALVLYGGIPFLPQAWSIGTEEQFYLLWPWVLRRAGRHVLPVVGGVFLLLLGVQRGIVLAFHAAQPTPGPELDFAFGFLYYFRLDCLVLGAVPAVLLFQRRTAVLRGLMAPATQWLTLAAVVALLAWGRPFPLHEQVYASLFAVLILNLAAAEKPVICLEASWLNYLGKLSYGLYMLHYLAVAAVLWQLGPWLDAQAAGLRWLLTLLATLGLSVGLAMLSYYGLERPFLRRKTPLERVWAGGSVARPR